MTQATGSADDNFKFYFVHLLKATRESAEEGPGVQGESPKDGDPKQAKPTSSVKGSRREPRRHASICMQRGQSPPRCSGAVIRSQDASTGRRPARGDHSSL